ncbi:mite allergen-like protein [Dermatophagoides farinae]|uniref:Mite allergen-like protein n=1 Tax=Dermatophagoides farinae TaxID=6954 RepID=A0A9D4NSK9_DERFA|nr:mite allergen-like protein [Dermatophagoides farinae]
MAIIEKFWKKFNFIYIWLMIITTTSVSNHRQQPQHYPYDDLLSSTSYHLSGQSSNQLQSYRCPLDENVPKKKLVCFYRVEDEYRPYDLDPCLCTHIVYSYVAVKENFAFIAGKKGDLKYLSALRNKNPMVKIIVSLRPTGTSFNLEDSKNITYPLPASNTLRHRFAKRIRDFINRHNLDGVDIDYEYFKMENNSNNQKRQYLISIIQSISESLKQNDDDNNNNRTILTLTTSRYPKHLADYYDFAEINKYVDFVNLPAFNFDQEGNTLIHPAKLHGMSEMENMDAIVDLALALGMPSNQLVIGVPTFGTLYRMANQSQTTPGSKAIGWITNNQPITTISHSKICDVRDKVNWTLVREKDLTAPYIYNNDKWIGFDDEISIKLKAKYIVLRRAAGMAFFHLNDDDFQNQCGLGSYPLLRSALSVFNQANDDINVKSHPLAFFNTSQQYFQSFLDVVQKYGNVERSTDDDDQDDAGNEVILPCNHNGYMRHPEDCTRFYRCMKLNMRDTSVQKLHYNCPPGLVFDEYFQICNWPSWSPTCLGSGEISSTMRSSFVCTKAGFFQDPENCEYFHYCSDLGKTYLQAYEFKCPFELGFNQDTLQCNWKWMVKGCQYVPPEERIVKDLHQILPQDIGSGASGGNEDRLDQIEPAASDISAMIQEVLRAQQHAIAADDNDDEQFMDDFEERSDHDDDRIAAQHDQIPITLPDSKDQSESSSKSKRFSYLNLSKIDEIYKRNPSYMARLQAITAYFSSLMSKLRYSFWNPATTNINKQSIKSRADHLDQQQTNNKWLKNPFNRMIPKFPKSLKKTKPDDGNDRKRKSLSTETMKVMTTTTTTQRPTRHKKSVFNKVPRLPKFSKRKRTSDKSSSSSAQQQNQKTMKKTGQHSNKNYHPSTYSQLNINQQMLPMFMAEESIHMPQFVQPPQMHHFDNHHQSLATNSYRGPSSNVNPSSSFTMMHPAESIIKPVSVPLSSSSSNTVANQFNKLNQFHQANLLNDYQVASSSFSMNSFAEPPPKKSMNNFNHNQNLDAHQSAPVVMIAADNGGGTKPQLYHNSYGLPSVNIRYSYLNNEQLQAKAANLQKPTVARAPLPPPSLPLSIQPALSPGGVPVKIEATKINFPEHILSEEELNSADLQLEQFLRTKFISTLPFNNKQLLALPESSLPPQLQRPKPLQTTHAPQLRQLSTKPQSQPLNHYQHHHQLLVPQHNQQSIVNSAVTGLPVTLTTAKQSNLNSVLNRHVINYHQLQQPPQPQQQQFHYTSTPTTSKPNQMNKFSSFITSTDWFNNERQKFFEQNRALQLQKQQQQLQQTRTTPTTTTTTTTTPRPTIPTTRKPKVIAQPQSFRPIISVPLPTSKTPVNYKLTPITDNVFELNNKQQHHHQYQPSKPNRSSSPRPKISKPITTTTTLASSSYHDSYDPHMINRPIELVRSTSKPQIKYDSYEWTTPSSLKDNKMHVDFNLMSAKDIDDEINSKKHFFKDDHSQGSSSSAFRPLDRPIQDYNRHNNFFPPIGDVFENYAATSEQPKASTQSFVHQPPPSSSSSSSPSTTTTKSMYTTSYDDHTTPVPWLSTHQTFNTNPSLQLLANAANINDTNEYIMLIDGNAQTILALLPDKPNHRRPFVYKGENSLLRNLSLYNGLLDPNLLPPTGDQILQKLDISKPDSDVLQAIFDKVKDELHGTEKLIPYEIDGIDYSGGSGGGGVSMHQARRIPQGTSGGSSSVADRYNDVSRNISPFTKAFTIRTTTTTTTTTTSSTTTSPPTTTTTATLPTISPTRQSWPSLDPYDDNNRIIVPNYPAPRMPTNRSSNVWYQDVPRLIDNNFADINGAYPDHDDDQPVVVGGYTTEESRTRSSIPTTTTTTTAAYTQPPSTTTTSTTTTESTIQYNPTTQKSSYPYRRPGGDQHRGRRPEYGHRQRGHQLHRQPQPQLAKTTIVPSIDHHHHHQRQPESTRYSNHFGQKLRVGNGDNDPTVDDINDSDRNVFYEEELPNFQDLRYPENQNYHHHHQRQRSSTTSTTTTTTTARPTTTTQMTTTSATTQQPITTESLINSIENTYYPESTIHNLMPDKSGIPESACTRPGIFQHPNDCNKYYECYWDKHINKFTLHPFECPVKLAFDSRIIGCASPNDPTQRSNLDCRFHHRYLF